MSNPEKNPYVGARTFERKESDLFFGREREAFDLLSLVISNRLVLFYAQSGAGKSSLVNTRLIPSLEEEGEYQVLPIGRVRRDEVTADAVQNVYIYNLLTSLSKNQADERALAELSFSEFLGHLQFTENNGYFYDLQSEANIFTSNGPDQCKYVLIIDQFEELFTTYDEKWKSRQDFFEQLATAMKNFPRLWVVLVMREDYIASLDLYIPHVPGGFRTRYYMQRLSTERAIEAVEGPVQRRRRSYGEGAARALVEALSQVIVHGPDNEDTHQPGQYVEPVQLQVVCSSLWEKVKDTEGEISFDVVQNHIKDINRALGNFYQQRVQEVAGSELARGKEVNERQIRSWFEKQLITESKRRNMVAQQPGGQSGGLDDKVVQEFVRNGLVREEKRGGGTTFYELTHDRMIEPIVENNHDWDLENSSPFITHVTDWEKYKRDVDLLGDQALIRAEQWAKENPQKLTKSDRDYLEACRKLQAEKEEVSKRARWRLVTLLSVVIFIAMAALAAFGFTSAADARRQSATAQFASTQAVEQSNKANTQAAIASTLQADAEYSASRAMAEKLAVQADAGSGDSLSLLLAVEALKQTSKAHQTHLPLAENVIQRAVDQLGNGTPLSGHSAPVRALAISPNGYQLATGSEDASVRVWDLTSKDPSASAVILNGHNASVRAVTFSNDGRWLASGSNDSTVRLWDMTNPAAASEPQVLKGHEGPVSSLAFSPDGQMLASGGYDNTIVLWDMTAKEITPSCKPKGHNKAITLLAFSPDGKYLLSGGDNVARVWQVSNCTMIFQLNHNDDVAALAFSLDGRYIGSGSNDHTVRVWDTLSGNEIFKEFHSDWVTSVAFSPDGKYIASGSWDKNACVWDIATRQKVVCIPHNDSVTSVAFSPDGKYIITGSLDKTARVNEIPTGDEFTRVTQGDRVENLAVSLDGRLLVTTGEGSTPRLWDISARQIQVEHESYSDEPVASLGEQTGEITGLSFSPDSTKLASSDAKGNLQIWDFQNWVPNAARTVIQNQSGPISVMGFTSNNYILGGSGENLLVQWDLSVNPPDRMEYIFSGYEGNFSPFAFDPGFGRLAVSGNDNIVQIWQDPNSHTDLKGHTGPIHALAYSPDGQWLASGSADKTIRVWDVRSDDPSSTPHILKGHSSDIYALAFSPNGHWLASAGGDHTIQLWDFTNGAPVESAFVLQDDLENIHALAFSPSGRWLASAGEDAAIQLWDLSEPSPDLKPIALIGHQSPVVALTFSPDGNWLVSGDKSGQVKVWGTDITSLQEEACLIAGRNLEWNEWEQYFPDQSYKKTCSLNKLPVSVVDHYLEPGDRLASTGSQSAVNQAVEEYQKSILQYPEISTTIPNTDLRARAVKRAVDALISSGDVLAQAIDVQAAIDKYMIARELDPKVNLAIDPSSESDLGSPETRAREIALPKLMDSFYSQLDILDVKNALENLRRALEIDPTISETLDANSWNNLCWRGSTQGYGKELEVSNACEKAVAMDPRNGAIIDSRALNRAINGNFPGAIQDFEYAVTWFQENGYSENMINERKSWLVSLKAEKNPFTLEVLDSIKNE